MKTKDNKLTTDNGQKQAELVMQTSLQLLPLIMNNIPQAVFWKDCDLIYLGCNQAFAEDAGFSSPAEIVGKTDFDMPWTDQAELYRADDRRVMEYGEAKNNYEEPQTTPNGSTIWLSTSKIPVRENGQVIAVLGMYEDITGRKQAEKALQASEQQFHTLYDNATIGLYRTTPDGRILMLNPNETWKIPDLSGMMHVKNFVKNLRVKVPLLVLKAAG
jgi:PAS domain S-box-containing protein